MIQVKFKKINENAVIPKYAYPNDSGFDFCTIEGVSVFYGEITLIRTGLQIELPGGISFLKEKSIDDYEQNRKDIFHSPLPINDYPFFNNIRNGQLILVPELQIRAKSGLALNHGIQVVNGPATVDNSYRGEIKVLITRVIPGQYFFNKGEKFAQGVISLVMSTPSVQFQEVLELSKTERSDGGFGSTGNW